MVVVLVGAGCGIVVMVVRGVIGGGNAWVCRCDDGLVVVTIVGGIVVVIVVVVVVVVVVVARVTVVVVAVVHLVVGVIVVAVSLASMVSATTRMVRLLGALHDVSNHHRGSGGGLLLPAGRCTAGPLHAFASADLLARGHIGREGFGVVGGDCFGNSIRNDSGDVGGDDSGDHGDGHDSIATACLPHFCGWHSRRIILHLGGVGGGDVGGDDGGDVGGDDGRDVGGDHGGDNSGYHGDGHDSVVACLPHFYGRHSRRIILHLDGGGSGDDGDIGDGIAAAFLTLFAARYHDRSTGIVGGLVAEKGDNLGSGGADHPRDLGTQGACELRVMGVLGVRSYIVGVRIGGLPRARRRCRCFGFCGQFEIRLRCSCHQSGYRPSWRACMTIGLTEEHFQMLKSGNGAANEVGIQKWLHDGCPTKTAMRGDQGVKGGVRWRDGYTQIKALTENDNLGVKLKLGAGAIKTGRGPAIATRQGAHRGEGPVHVCVNGNVCPSHRSSHNYTHTWAQNHIKSTPQRPQQLPPQTPSPPPPRPRTPIF